MSGRCETCRFREPDNRPEYPGAGFCQRYPPTLAVWTASGPYGEPQANFEQHWPWMAANARCGEYQEGQPPC